MVVFLRPFSIIREDDLASVAPGLATSVRLVDGVVRLVIPLRLPLTTTPPEPVPPVPVALRFAARVALRLCDYHPRFKLQRTRLKRC